MDSEVDQSDGKQSLCDTDIKKSTQAADDYLYPFEIEFCLAGVGFLISLARLSEFHKQLYYF